MIGLKRLTRKSQERRRRTVEESLYGNPRSFCLLPGSNLKWKRLSRQYRYPASTEASNVSLDSTRHNKRGQTGLGEVNHPATCRVRQRIKAPVLEWKARTNCDFCRRSIGKAVERSFASWGGTQLSRARRKALSGFYNGETDTFTVGGLGEVNNVAQTANTAINIFVYRKLCMQQQKRNKTVQ